MLPCVYMGPMRRSLAERFWEKVRTAGPDDCWEWLAGRTPSGYGKMGSGGYKGTTLLAHRVSLQLTGIDASGHFVLHSCDNRVCVNPKHLRLGTAAENTQDMWDRDRAAIEFKLPHTKLSDRQVDEIRTRYISVKQLAREYGVTESEIRAVVEGRIRQRALLASHTTS